MHSKIILIIAVCLNRGMSYSRVGNKNLQVSHRSRFDKRENRSDINTTIPGMHDFELEPNTYRNRAIQ